MDTPKERRVEIRTLVIAEACSWGPADGLLQEYVELSNLSINGVFLKSIKQPAIGEEVQVVFKLPGDLGPLTLKGIVKWRRWQATKKSNLPVGFAVQFKYDSLNVKRVMEAFCIYMRNRQIIIVSKRIIEEFFGPAIEEPIV